MKLTRILIIFTLLLLFVCCVSAQKHKSVKALKLSADDKTEIINQIFNDGFEKLMADSENSDFQTCLTPVVEDKKVIFVSTEIEKELIKPQVKGYRLMVMSAGQMKRRVQKEKGECYFRVTPFVVSDSKVKIILARYFKMPAFVHGTGFQYEFEKVQGRWKKRRVGNYNLIS